MHNSGLKTPSLKKLRPNLNLSFLSEICSKSVCGKISSFSLLTFLTDDVAVCNERNECNKRKKVGNKRSWRNDQNTRIEAAVASATLVSCVTFVTLRTLRALR